MPATELIRERILAMPAGRELDALVAERILDRRILSQKEMREEATEVWETQPSCCVFIKGFIFNGHDFEQEFSCYSTDIDAAWQVVEEMKAYGGDVFIEWWGNEWFVSPKPLIIRNRDGTRQGAGAPTAPHAICLAALLSWINEQEMLQIQVIEK